MYEELYEGELWRQCLIRLENIQDNAICIRCSSDRVQVSRSSGVPLRNITTLRQVFRGIEYRGNFETGY